MANYGYILCILECANVWAVTIIAISVHVLNMQKLDAF